MDNNDFMQEIMMLRERMTKNESIIENLIRQQDSIDKLAQAVQELAISMQTVQERTRNVIDRVEDIEDDKNEKAKYIWTTVVGGIVGTIVTVVMAQVFN